MGIRRACRVRQQEHRDHGHQRGHDVARVQSVTPRERCRDDDRRGDRAKRERGVQAVELGPSAVAPQDAGVARDLHPAGAEPDERLETHEHAEGAGKGHEHEPGRHGQQPESQGGVHPAARDPLARQRDAREIADRADREEQPDRAVARARGLAERCERRPEHELGDAHRCERRVVRRVALAVGHAQMCLVAGSPAQSDDPSDSPYNRRPW